MGKGVKQARQFVQSNLIIVRDFFSLYIGMFLSSTGLLQWSCPSIEDISCLNWTWSTLTSPIQIAGSIWTRFITYPILLLILNLPPIINGRNSLSKSASAISRVAHAPSPSPFHWCCFTRLSMMIGLSFSTVFPRSQWLRPIGRSEPPSLFISCLCPVCKSESQSNKY